MRRAAVAAAIAALLVTSVACSPAAEDQNKLAGYLRRSELAPRTFDFQTQGPNDSYEVRGSVADDLRYKMALSHDGRVLVQYIVRDDALAVRLADPAFGKKLANELGHPTVDAALKAGKWVIDPSGAPALFRRDTTAPGLETGDPFKDTHDALRHVSDYIGDARTVKKFSLEDIEYRPAYDPWRYPSESAHEVRYDLVRPALPKSEAQTVGGANGQDVANVAQFRKTSVFVERGKVDEVCSVVDILGHEDIIALKQRGLKSNPFLANLLNVILRGETAVPIVPRTSILTEHYTRSEDVELPGDAVRGKLDTFLAAFQQAVTSGALKPARGGSVTACRRPVNAKTTS